MELRKFSFNWMLLRDVVSSSERSRGAYIADKHPLCAHPLARRPDQRMSASFTFMPLCGGFIEQFLCARHSAGL